MASGGVFNTPTAIVGEGNPAYREFVIASDPAYRTRNLGLWAAAGGDLGIPGFESGGILGFFESLNPLDLAKKAAKGVADTAAGALPSPFDHIADALINDILGSKKASEAPAKGAASAATMAGMAALGAAVLSGNVGANQKLGQAMAQAAGWTGLQWTDFNAVEMREAGWNQFADNPTSTAYGIAQNINPSTYPAAGTRAGGWSPAAQIAWMISYIQGRYGTPAAALAHEVNYGWYDQGGFLQPGLTMALNTTGRPEAVGGTGGGVIVNVQVGPSTRQPRPDHPQPDTAARRRLQ